MPDRRAPAAGERRRRAARLLKGLADDIEKTTTVFSAGIRDIVRERVCAGYLPEEIEQALCLLEAALRQQGRSDDGEKLLLRADVARVARSSIDEIYETFQRVLLARAAARERRQLDLPVPLVCTPG